MWNERRFSWWERALTESLRSLMFQHEDGTMRRESSISYWHEIKHFKKAWLVVWPVWFAILVEHESRFVTCVALYSDCSYMCYPVGTREVGDPTKSLCSFVGSLLDRLSNGDEREEYGKFPLAGYEDIRCIFHFENT